MFEAEFVPRSVVLSPVCTAQETIERSEEQPKPADIK
jgi:hypothetical protein